MYTNQARVQMIQEKLNGFQKEIKLPQGGESRQQPE
jgi:hypothetical protein